MASHLPEELVEEILSTVPATSLKKLRSTCKQWNALFKDERFAKKHFGKAAKQSQVLVLKGNRLYSVCVNLHEIAAPSIMELKVSHNISFYISDFFHCDGLLLCTNDQNIAVWNPCLGESRLIQPKADYKKYKWFALGYQNSSSSCRSYKILKCWFHYIPNIPIVTDFEIFELSLGSWRVLDVVNPKSIILSNGVSLKGNSYWVSFNCIENRGLGTECRLVLNFNFSTETFTRLYFPFQRFYSDVIALSVLRDEELLVLHESIKTLKLDIWVTRNIDQTKALSLSKLIAVDLYTHNCLLSRFVNFFIDEEKKVAMCIGKEDDENAVCIIGEDGKYREFSLEESTNEFMLRFACNYVPSLVHIQQG